MGGKGIAALWLIDSSDSVYPYTLLDIIRGLIIYGLDILKFSAGLKFRY